MDGGSSLALVSARSSPNYIQKVGCGAGLRMWISFRAETEKRRPLNSLEVKTLPEAELEPAGPGQESP